MWNVGLQVTFHKLSMRNCSLEQESDDSLHSSPRSHDANLYGFRPSPCRTSHIPVVPVLMLADWLCLQCIIRSAASHSLYWNSLAFYTGALGWFYRLRLLGFSHPTQLQLAAESHLMVCQLVCASMKEMVSKRVGLQQGWVLTLRLETLPLSVSTFRARS